MESYSLAYIRLYCQPAGQARCKDKDLSLYHLQVKANPYKIISTESIIRSALLVQDSKRSDDYFVVNTVNSDMFLRMQSLIF